MGGIAAAKGVMVPRRMREPSALRVVMRSCGRARSVRYAARAVAMPYRPEWSCGLMERAVIRHPL